MKRNLNLILNFFNILMFFFMVMNLFFDLFLMKKWKIIMQHFESLEMKMIDNSQICLILNSKMKKYDVSKNTHINWNAWLWKHLGWWHISGHILIKLIFTLVPLYRWQRITSQVVVALKSYCMTFHCVFWHKHFSHFKCIWKSWK